MFKKENLLQRPNYLLTTYQGEIYRQLKEYMQANKYSQQDISEKLGVSNAYVSQILNGNFNFTLRKLIELAIMIDKVPCLEFVDHKEYWRRCKDGVKEHVVKKFVFRSYSTPPSEDIFYATFSGGMLPTSQETEFFNESVEN